MKFTIFHLADSHWICEFEDKDNPDNNRPTRQEKAFYDNYLAVFKDLKLDKHIGKGSDDASVVVHTGDFANFYIPEFRRHPVEMQFKDIQKRHLSELKLKFEGAKHFIAVPGNHDTNKTDGAAKDIDKFRDFIFYLDGWETPFTDSAAVRIPVPGPIKRDIVLFLFNSAMSVYEPRGSSEPVAFASIRRKYRKKPSETDYLRIAVLHHNVLPQYGQEGAETSEEMFVDNGDFNAYLSKSNFKLVLSGHQHLDNDVCFAVTESVLDGSCGRPIVENSVLSLSAPSFLRPELATQLGFNVIELNLSASSNLVEAVVTKYRYLKNNQRFEEKPVTKHLLLIPRIEDVGSPEKQRERLQIYPSFLDKLYDPGFPTEILKRTLTRSSPNDHFERMRNSIRVAQNLAVNNVFGMYSIAILPPSTWMGHQRTFHRLFLANQTRAFHRSKASGALFNFSFSKPVYSAITQSIANARMCSITGQFSANYDSLDREVKSFLSTSYKRSDGSLSQWEGTLVESGNPASFKNEEHYSVFHNHKASIRYGCSGEGIANDFKLEQADEYAVEPFEIARIVIWQPDVFKSNEALEFLQYHEENLIPLFWLNPNRLRARNNEFRRAIGYALLYAHKFKEYGDDEKPILCSGPLAFLNSASGEEVTTAQLLNQTRVGSLNSLDIFLWGHNGAPERYRQSHSHLSAEFSALLARPDILFAVDAYALSQIEQLDNVQNILSQTYGWCEAWLNELPI